MSVNKVKLKDGLFQLFDGIDVLDRLGHRLSPQTFSESDYFNDCGADTVIADLFLTLNKTSTRTAHRSCPDC